MLWRVIESEMCPPPASSAFLRCVVADRARGADGKYRPGEQPPEGSRATDDKGGANMTSAGWTTTCWAECSNWSHC